jgi:hypothetical protein
MDKVNIQFGESAPTMNVQAGSPKALQGYLFKAMMKYMEDLAGKITSAVKDFEWGKPETKKNIAMVSMEGWLTDKTAWATVSLLGTFDGGVQVMVGMGLKEAEKRNASNLFIAPTSEEAGDTVKTAVRMMKDLKDSVVF